MELFSKTNFKNVMSLLGLKEMENNVFSKYFPETNALLKVDFANEQFIYPENEGLKIHDRTICNFSQGENFVVFECVHRLLEKGYKPSNIELEPRWQVGHGASGGRADILICDHSGKSLLIIECKTWGNEFNKAWQDTLNGKGQLFTYAHQERSTQYLCLYASGLEGGALKYASHIIAIRDNDDILKRRAAENPPSYREADSAKELYEVWKRTYECNYATRGIFEPDVQPYQIGKAKYTVADLQTVTEADIQPKYHEFATILRQHNVSGRENAFDKLVNLFLCKIVDEKHNPDDLQFYWRGIAFDTYFDLIDRLQRLYRDGMREFLKEDVTYIDNQTIREAFKFFRNDPDATRDKILDYFRRQKYFTNNDFSFLDVHNEQLFYQNAAILLKIVRMLQDIRLNGDQQNQFLGDMFEFFLDQGFKQTEGQYFTPLPITRFIVLSLPLETIFSNEKNPPNVIDYACGAGHFLTEMASQLRSLRQGQEVRDFYRQFYGIEKEYRLSKVAKVSAFMYNQDEINIVYADALARHSDIPEGAFTLLVSNPPYSVKGFLETLPESERSRYDLIHVVKPDSYPKNDVIEAFFLERAKQLLAPHGMAGIITPSSILSNSSNRIYPRVREILLQFFDIIALVELGSVTFGKTGTNTVTLFLRRKDDNPAPSDHYRNRVNAWFDGDIEKDRIFADEHLLKAYCGHIGIAIEDYQTLLRSNPSPTLLNTNLFKDYRRAFDASSEVRTLQKQKSFLQKSDDERQTELDRRFIQFAREIEREKLYYFIQAYTQPCPVIVVRSPQGTKEMKKFLGYEWSSAKGQEGIKYLHGSIDRIQTPLFDPQDSKHPQKISTLIRNNFMGKTVSVPESLQPYVTVARLVDLLDFSRDSFDKQIFLVPREKTSQAQNIFRFSTRKAQDLYEIRIGGTPDRNNPGLFNGNNLWVSISDMNRKLITNTKERISDEAVKQSNVKLIPKGTVLYSFKLTIGKVAISGADLYTNEAIAAFVPKTNQLDQEYLYYFLESGLISFEDKTANIFGKSLNTEILEQIQIPVPPPEVQEQIVAECQAIDAEVEQAEEEINGIDHQIQKIIQNALDTAAVTIKIGELAETASGGTPLTTKLEYYDNGTIPWITSGEVNQGEIFDSEKKITELALKESSAKIVPQNSVLIAMYGATAGKVGILRIPGGAAINQAICAIFPNERYDPKFLFYQMKSLYEKMLAMRSGKARSNLSQEKIREIRVKIIPIDKQRDVVKKIEELESRLQSARAVITSAPERRRKVLEKYLVEGD
ncbi:MAG: restriction endonuclease [Patescibacteria group bacterium]|nr:MAG: restriction endonuclease [Patescibacteria group bacterium]